mgnify:CR=1 FL=1
MDIRIATRKSALALWQAEHVADLLRPLPEVGSVELVPLSTRGDEILDKSLQKIGGKGLFIKELEVAMQAGEADIEARFDLGPLPEAEARFEVKLYSRDVPGPELDKFRRDLKKTGVKYGLMVSLSSRLTGVRGPLFVEDSGDYTAVFLPNAGLDGVRLMAATAMLKAIMLYHARSAAARRVPARRAR